MSQFCYRPNVAAIIKRDDGKILVGERSDVAGAWQFPQGGVKAQESAEQALTRELQEEISLPPTEYRIIEAKGPYRYLFEKGRLKEGCHGQEQTYFLVQLLNAGATIDVETKDAEFKQVRWMEPAQFKLEWVPRFKQEVYRQVFRDFFGHNL